MRHYGDITKLSGYDLPVVDVITGGSPCQDLSVAGKRAGLDGERSGLFIEQIRIVKEMRERDRSNGRADEYIRPRYMVWENVPGAFSSNKGKDFQTVLTEIVRIVKPDAPDVPCPTRGGWSKSGCLYDDMGRWSVAWRVHDAQFWGVPQRRKRIALVADFGGKSAPEILFERRGLRWNPAESGEERKGTAEDAERGVGETGITCLNDQVGSVMGVSENVVGALRAQEHGHQPAVCYGISSYESNAMKSANPHSGVYEAETSRTLDLNGGNPACNQGGIAVVFDASRRHNYEPLGDISETVQAHYGTGGGNAPMVMESSAWDGSQVSPTLTANNADGSQRMPDKDNFNAVVQSMEVFHCTTENDKVQTLKARDYKDPQVVAYGLDRASYNQGQNAKFGFCIDEEKIGAQVAKGPGAVCTAVYCRNGTENELINGTLQAKSNGGTSYNLQNVCRIGYIVRRLTPTECERLQGFPDGWTDIGDWVDSKGKKHKGESDSPRYKALGNSIAIPFFFYLLRRISAQYERPATMGSLFDGIGGFPLCWERCNGKGTAIWASEIEEFPIAVTKKHFGDDDKGIKGDIAFYL